MHWLVITEVIPGSQQQPAVLSGNDLLDEGEKKDTGGLKK